MGLGGWGFGGGWWLLGEEWGLVTEEGGRKRGRRGDCGGGGLKG